MQSIFELKYHTIAHLQHVLQIVHNYRTGILTNSQMRAYILRVQYQVK